MTQYLLSVYQPDGPAPPAAELESIMRDVRAVNEDIRAAGGWVFSAGLHEPSTATVLRARDGETVMTDGPYLEGKEHLGGFTLVEAPDLDVALGWGRRLAGAIGLPIEVRPVQEHH